MKKLLVVTCLLHMIAISLCAPSSSKETIKASNTTYDQRQVGKYNIHFNIKDVAIIALSSEDLVDHIGDSDAYGDYYDYEESEYTVDPVTADLSGRPTTKKAIVTSTLIPSIDGLNFSSFSTKSHLEPTSPPVSTSPQTLLVIHEKPSSTPSSPDNDKNVDKADVSYQPDQIPVQVIVEPLLKPKVRPSPQSIKRKLTNRQVSVKNEDEDYEIRPRRRRGQIMDRIRARHNNRLSPNGSNACGRGQTSDGEVGCRVRRSGMSGMSGFFKMLTKFLPQRGSK